MHAFEELFNKQVENQQVLLDKGSYKGFCTEGTERVPVDDVKLMSYHIQQEVSEIGEVLAADKRWKNFRNGKFDHDEKLDEIADVFIVAMNIAMYSGFNAEQVAKAIDHKLDVVKERIMKV